MAAICDVEELRRRLRLPLPGNAAKEALCPRPPRERLANGDLPSLRSAAVLILLVPEHHDFAMPLLRRRAIDGDVHSGQLALPGGGREADESPIQAALREAQEELGIDPDSVEILGCLTPQRIPVSGYRVDPIVGWSAERPRLLPDSREVDAALWTSLAHLLDHPPVVRRGERLGVSMEMPGWELEEGFLWGATAMILAELLALVRSEPAPKG